MTMYVYSNGNRGINAIPGITAAKLFTLGTDTVVASASSVTAGTNDASWYDIAFADVTSTQYRLVLYISTTVVGSDTVTAGDGTISIDSSPVTVLPVTGAAIDRVNGTTLSYFVGETVSTTISVVDGDGNSVDTTGMTLSIVFEDSRTGTDVAIVSNASITKTTTTVSFSVPSAVTATQRKLAWSLRNTTAVLLHGVCEVSYAAA